MSKADRNPLGLRWQVIVALILGAILLACGVALFVSAHWDRSAPARASPSSRDGQRLPPRRRPGRASASRPFDGPARRGNLSTGAAIALVGQIFNIEEHWPAAILMWAWPRWPAGFCCATRRSRFLRCCSFRPGFSRSFRITPAGHIGESVYIGPLPDRLGGALPHVLPRLEAKIVQGILLAVAAIGRGGSCAFCWKAGVPGATRPICLSACAHLGLGGHCRDSAALRALQIPQERDSSGRCDCFYDCAALVPTHLDADFDNSTATGFSLHGNEPNLASHALVAAFCVFIIWWGVRQASQALVNLGIVGFAITVFWFYFSDIFDKLGRSLGLIGLGILFLAGGWALEKMRRNLVAGMKQCGNHFRYDYSGGAMKWPNSLWNLHRSAADSTALVSSIAAKYLYQRATCPRVWVRTAAYDPEMVMRGRYLSLRLTVDGCQSTLPSRLCTPNFPRNATAPPKPNGFPSTGGGTPFNSAPSSRWKATS
jgi:hypothetical protein